MYWLLPPVVGQKVILNPEGGNFEEYNHRQAKGDAGYIVRLDFDLNETEWALHSEKDKKHSIALQIIWENGHENTYRLPDVLPIYEDMKDLHVIETSNGDIRGTSEEIEAKLDDMIIKKRSHVYRHIKFDKTYRDNVFRKVLYNYNSIINGQGVTEERQSAIELLASLGYTEPLEPSTEVKRNRILKVKQEQQEAVDFEF